MLPSHFFFPHQIYKEIHGKETSPRNHPVSFHAFCRYLLKSAQNTYWEELNLPLFLMKFVTHSFEISSTESAKKIPFKLPPGWTETMYRVTQSMCWMSFLVSLVPGIKTKTLRDPLSDATCLLNLQQYRRKWDVANHQMIFFQFSPIHKITVVIIIIFIAKFRSNSSLLCPNLCMKSQFGH